MTSTMLPPSLPTVVAAEQSYLQIPSQPEWIAPTIEYLREKAVLCGVCDEARARKLTLALHEALTNAVVHGNLELSSDLKEQSDSAFAEALAERAADPRYGMRPVEIHIDYDGDSCRWVLTDQGQGFDVARALARAEDPDPETMLASGRGILMMRTLLDDVRYEAGGRRVVLTMSRHASEERRRQPRRPVQRPIRVAPMRADGTVDWESATEGVTQNLSPDGIAILQQRLAVSDRILIGIDWDGQVLYVPAEVRHCQARPGDVIELGCRFQAAPAATEGTATAHVDQAIGGLLEQLSHPGVPHDDRRKHPRAVYTARILVQHHSHSEPIAGFGRDLSRGGIAFLTSVPLPHEDVVVSLPQSDQTMLRVMARIIRCNPLMTGVYEAAARFLDVAES